jgi:hypothetical protein
MAWAAQRVPERECTALKVAARKLMEAFQLTVYARNLRTAKPKFSRVQKGLKRSSWRTKIIPQRSARDMGQLIRAGLAPNKDDLPFPALSW